MLLFREGIFIFWWGTLFGNPLHDSCHMLQYLWMRFDPFQLEDLWALTLSHQISSEKDANFCAEKTLKATFSSEWKLMGSGDFRRTWKCAGECRYLDIFSRKWSLNLEFVVKNAWGKKDVKWKPGWVEMLCFVAGGGGGGYCWNSQVEQLEFNSAVIH